MRARVLTAAAVSVLLLLPSAPAAASPQPKPKRSGPMTVVALIDSGINPYSVAFRDRSKLAYRHPSTYLPGYPRGARALPLSLDLPYERALERDAAVWDSVVPGRLYWIPGTRIVGAISLGAGGTSCPFVADVPPANILGSTACEEHRILDDHGHGTMTASRAAGFPHSLAPRARIVEIEGLGADSVRWAAEQPWIDIQTNSWVNLVPPPASGLIDDTSAAFADAAGRMLTLAASGNGTAYSQGYAPTPTYVLTTAPPGVVLVGGHDNGRMTLWSGAPPHLVADAYAGYAAPRASSGGMEPHPIACCTSAASPYAAGGAAAIVERARRILRDGLTGVRDGVVARGPAGLVRAGPLADGRFTLEELKDVLLHTAEALPFEGRDDGLAHWMGEPRPPDQTEFGPGGNPFCQGCWTLPVDWTSMPAYDPVWPLVGYGAINERSTALAFSVLAGRAPLPQRAAADGLYDADQQLREAVFGI